MIDSAGDPQPRAGWREFAGDGPRIGQDQRNSIASSCLSVSRIFEISATDMGVLDSVSALIA